MFTFCTFVYFVNCEIFVHCGHFVTLVHFLHFVHFVKFVKFIHLKLTTKDRTLDVVFSRFEGLQ